MSYDGPVWGGATLYGNTNLNSSGIPSWGIKPDSLGNKNQPAAFWAVSAVCVTVSWPSFSHWPLRIPSTNPTRLRKVIGMRRQRPLYPHSVRPGKAHEFCRRRVAVDPGQCLQEDVNTVYIPLCGGVGGGGRRISTYGWDADKQEMLVFREWGVSRSLRCLENTDVNLTTVVFAMKPIRLTALSSVWVEGSGGSNLQLRIFCLSLLKISSIFCHACCWHRWEQKQQSFCDRSDLAG